jgi:hypothetical protein
MSLALGWLPLLGSNQAARVQSPVPYQLSRESDVDQRFGAALVVQIVDGGVDGPVEGGGVGEGLVGQMMRLEIVPDNLDVIELGCILGQPLDPEPVLARIECGERELADVDRAVVLNGTTGLVARPGLGP